jgi:hypothetical protein
MTNVNAPKLFQKDWKAEPNDHGRRSRYQAQVCACSPYSSPYRDMMGIALRSDCLAADSLSDGVLDHSLEPTVSPAQGSKDTKYPIHVWNFSYRTAGTVSPAAHMVT